MLRPSDRSPGVALGDGVELPATATVGANVVIHAGTRIGAGAVIQDGAVLGKPPALSPRSFASREAPAQLVVGEQAVICAGAIVLAGATVGRDAVIADQAHVRERSVVGPGSVLGRGSQVDNDVTIGARVRIQSGCYITAFSSIEDDVFVGPGVVTTNDNTMARRPTSDRLEGPILRRACRVGAGSIVLPGVQIGSEAFVAAGALVTRDVPERSVVMGVPARRIGEVPDHESIDNWL